MTPKSRFARPTPLRPKGNKRRPDESCGESPPFSSGAACFCSERSEHSSRSRTTRCSALAWCWWSCSSSRIRSERGEGGSLRVRGNEPEGAISRAARDDRRPSWTGPVTPATQAGRSRAPRNPGSRPSAVSVYRHCAAGATGLVCSDDGEGVNADAVDQRLGALGVVPESEDQRGLFGRGLRDVWLAQGGGRIQGVRDERAVESWFLPAAGDDPYVYTHVLDAPATPRDPPRSRHPTRGDASDGAVGRRAAPAQRPPAKTGLRPCATANDP
jgi:hypothetical protein